MTKEQFRAFEWHCRSSETYRYLRIDMQARVERELNEWRPTGEMALEDFERWEEQQLEPFLEDRYRYRTIRVKGYDKDAPFGKYFWEDWPKHLQESADEVDDKHHNGYFQRQYMEEE